MKRHLVKLILRGQAASEALMDGVRNIGGPRAEKRNPKIVCIGLGKTGTTTFGQCMTALGYRHIYSGPPQTEAFRDGDLPRLKKMIDAHDSFDDFPWAYMFRFFDEYYPGSKFILTTRRSTDAWFESLCRFYDRTGPTEAKKIFYGYYSPYENPGHHKRLYDSHNDAVRRYFAGRPDLLEACWENGDGWAQICGFLNRDVPDLPFPRANVAPETFDYAAAREASDRKLAQLRATQPA